MTKHASRRRSRRMRGGSNYTSAATYGMYVNGPGNSQFNRTMEGSGQSNTIIGVQGQNAIPASYKPTNSNLSLVQSAGRRRRGRKGGFLGSVVKDAIVPFALLGMQQSYRRSKKGGRKTRRRRH